MQVSLSFAASPSRIDHPAEASKLSCQTSFGYSRGNVVLDSAGNLYGTAISGGLSGNGVVYEITDIKGTSKTVVTTSGSPSFAGQAVTFTATVTSTKGAIPNGEMVTFYDGTTVLGTAALSGGTAAFTTSSLTAKIHTIKATYAGDSTFWPSSGSVQQVVNSYSTTTTLTSAPNPSSFGQAVTFTAQVTTTGPSTPTGKVKFLDGGTTLGTTTLSGGVARLIKSNLAVGTHAIAAQYLGDFADAKSTSSVVNQTVQ